MITPALEFFRFGISLLAGLAAGIFYLFLTPLRPKHTVLADLLFFMGEGYLWLWVGFSVCDGDLRIAWLLGIGMGAICSRRAFRRLLLPVFVLFWRGVACLTRPIQKIIHIFFKK